MMTYLACFCGNNTSIDFWNLQKRSLTCRENMAP